MIIPGRISVAEIIDSPGFHSFRSGAPDTWRSVPTFAGPAGGRRSLTQPSPKRQAARADRPGPRESRNGPASALRDDEVRSAVRGVCRFVLVRIERLIFTDRSDGHAGRVDAELDHVVKRRLGALFAEHEVVPVSYTHLTLPTKRIV